MDADTTLAALDFVGIFVAVLVAVLAAGWINRHLH